MTTPTPPPKRVHPLAAAGAIAFVVGLVAWPWTGDWRTVATGAGALLIGCLVAAATSGRGDA